MQRRDIVTRREVLVGVPTVGLAATVPTVTEAVSRAVVPVEPVAGTGALLKRYSQWLHYERWHLIGQFYGYEGNAFDFIPINRHVTQFFNQDEQPIQRMERVLRAAGVDVAPYRERG